jgi:hypothetical protein
MISDIVYFIHYISHLSVQSAKHESCTRVLAQIYPSVCLRKQLVLDAMTMNQACG